MNTERTGTRDPWLHDWLSRMHRTWGENVPAVDLDLVEYDDGKPVAILEFKHDNAANVSKRALRPLVALADMAGLPIFLVRYGVVPCERTSLSNDLVRMAPMFRINPLNERADSQLAPFWHSVPLSEFSFVSFLYGLRGRALLEETSIDPYALEGAPIRPAPIVNALLTNLQGARPKV